jgi:TonB-linked SusC/RagA family outer membrane protein
MKKKRHFIPLNGGIIKALKIMKLSFIFSFITLLNLSAGVYSQSQKFSISMNNAKLVEVLSQIEKESNISFYYRNEDIDHSRSYSINYRNQELFEILDDLFQNSDLTFKMIDNFVAIMKSAETETAVQQAKTITGTVTDKSGDPLPGVSIYVKGTTLGTISSVDGSYSIQVSDNDAVLVFSFIGFENQEINMAGRSSINIVMVEETTGLEEVVVTGYGTVTKEAYTGSATVVSSRQIEDRPVATIQEVLRGNSPGTLVTGTGQPGVGQTVRLRGISSMNASNAPLYVIDGVIFSNSNMSGNSDYSTNPMNTINPADIKSVTVLKDAASASLYGSRGANGVIVITTKQGRKTDKPQYTIDYQMGFANIAKSSTPDLVNADEFMELWLEGEMHYQVRRKTGYDDFFPEIRNLYADKENYIISGRNYTEWMNYAKGQFNSHFRIENPEGGYYDEFFTDDGERGPHYDKLANTNWYDEVTQTAPFQKFNVSTSGGNNTMNYYASLEYFNQQGILIGSSLERYSLRTNLSSKDKDSFVHWGLNNSMSFSDQNGPRSDAYGYAMPQYTALAIAPVAPVYLEDGSYNLSLPKDVNNNQNPIAVVENNTYERPQTKIMTSGWIQLNFTDWLYLNNRASLDYTHARRRQWYNKDFGDGLSDNGSLYERDARRRTIMNTTLLHFSKAFNEVHNLNGYVGTEVEDMQYEYINGTGINFPTNKTPYLSAAATPESLNGDGSTYGQFSIISAANYIFNDRYYLSGTFRNDQSSRFAPEFRDGNFWSVSGAWRLSEESFMQGISFIDNLKIKGSYGTQGTLPGEYYAWQSRYSFGYDYMMEPGGVQSDIANKELTWEENKIFNIGFESRLFNRLNLNVEYYTRRTDNLLIDLPISRTTGFSTVLVNSEASLHNKGIEIELNADIIRTADFTWDVNFNMATLKNEHSGLPSDIIGSTQIRRNGESTYTWYMPEWAGTDPETGQQRWYTTDEQGNNVITTEFDEAENRVVGKALPDINGGFSTSVNWKGLELSALFTYAMGYKVMDYTGRTATKNDGVRDYRGIERDQLDRWTPDNMSGKNPIRVNTSSTWDRYRSSRHLYNGDYLKLKNIKLQYSIPKSVTDLLKLRNAMVFAQAENLWVANELVGFDPEISLSGFRDADQYPTATTYTFGLKLNF